MPMTPAERNLRAMRQTERDLDRAMVALLGFMSVLLVLAIGAVALTVAMILGAG